jgi:hypothetical protein
VVDTARHRGSRAIPHRLVADTGRRRGNRLIRRLIVADTTPRRDTPLRSMVHPEVQARNTARPEAHSTVLREARRPSTALHVMADLPPTAPRLHTAALDRLTNPDRPIAEVAPVWAEAHRRIAAHPLMAEVVVVLEAEEVVVLEAEVAGGRITEVEVAAVAADRPEVTADAADSRR